MSVLERATSPYSAVEAWAYDRFIAPAVLSLARKEVDRFVGQPEKDARLLEVGCGGGQLAIELLRRRPDVDYTGLDLSPAQVARADARVRRAGLCGRFVQGSALSLPFDDASFDFVMSVASLKHWPDRAHGLAECVRVLAPGGTLLVVEADRGCRYEDSGAFVRGWALPAVVAPLTHVLFRALVAGQSVDLDDARELARALPLVDAEVTRVPGTPGLRIQGRKTAKPEEATA